MADEIRVNGNIHSWGSIKVKVGGETFYGFDLIAYGDKLEVVQAYGMGKHHAPRARTRGKYVTDPGKLRGPKGTMQALREKLASLSTDGTSYGNVEFQVVAEFVEANDVPMIVELERTRWVEDASNHEESPDPLKDEITTNYMLIRRNGLTLFDPGGEPAP